MFVKECDKERHAVTYSSLLSFLLIVTAYERPFLVMEREGCQKNRFYIGTLLTVYHSPSLSFTINRWEGE